jgi:cytochrome c-type biogenesis protein CcmE
MNSDTLPPVAVEPPNNGSVSRRVKLTLVLAILGCGIGALAFIAARSGAEFYVTPTEIVATGKPGVDYRLGGRVVPGSIQWDSGHTFVHFLITDAADTEAYGIKPNAPTIPVIYDGVVPDLFEERAFVVLGGRYSSNAGFAASSLIIKHESEFIKERERSLGQ